MQAQEKRKYTPRINSGGNYCGHKPDAPAFREVINRCVDQTRHTLLKTAIKKLGRYYDNPNILGNLGEICSNGDPRKNRKDGSPRQVRSERRDVSIMVMAYCLSKINLMKLQVGVVPYHDPNELYESPTEQQIADAIGQNIERVRSALAHWKHAGYLSITQRRRKNEAGNWESKSPIICILDTVFILIGIPRKWLKSCRDFQTKKWEEERLKRFKAAAERAAEKERDLSYAKTKAEAVKDAKAKAARDLFLKDITPKLNQLPNKQKSWHQRTHHGPPTR